MGTLTQTALLGIRTRLYQNKWKAEITTFRQQIRDELSDSPSLKLYLVEIFDDTYQDARKVIARLMDKPLNFFPEAPPASSEDVLKEDWFFDDL